MIMILGDKIHLNIQCVVWNSLFDNLYYSVENSVNDLTDNFIRENCDHDVYESICNSVWRVVESKIEEYDFSNTNK